MKRGAAVVDRRRSEGARVDRDLAPIHVAAGPNAVSQTAGRWAMPPLPSTTGSRASPPEPHPAWVGEAEVCREQAGGHAASPGQGKGGIGAQDAGAQADEGRRRGRSRRPVQHLPEGGHQLGVADGVRARDMDDATEVFVVKRPADDGEEVGDVDPAHPLAPVADPAPEAPADEPGQAVHRRSATVEHDAGAHDDLAAGGDLRCGGLPGPSHTGHLGRAVHRRRRLVEDYLAGVAVDGQGAGLDPHRRRCRQRCCRGCERADGLDSRARQQFDIGRGRAAVDQRAGQVDERRPLQLRRPGPDRGPVPCDLAVRGGRLWRPGEHDHLVAPGRQVGGEPPAQGPGPTCQHDLQRGLRFSPGSGGLPRV